MITTLALQLSNNSPRPFRANFARYIDTRLQKPTSTDFPQRNRIEKPRSINNNSKHGILPFHDSTRLYPSNSSTKSR